MKIADHLGIGRENAKSLKTLQQEMGLDRDDICRLIDAARRSGVPICDSISSRPVFWLAKTRGEMLEFCQELERFEKMISKTRKICLKTLTAVE